jgi:hypothetical protein
LSVSFLDIVIKCSHILEFTQRSSAAAELVRLDGEVLQNGHKQVCHRRVVLRVEAEVLAVFETSTGEDEWDV